MSRINSPKIEIHTNGHRALTTVTLDGRQLPVTRVLFDTDEGDESGGTLVTLTIAADVFLDGDPAVVIAELEAAHA
jgi:hypothetical protein